MARPGVIESSLPGMTDEEIEFAPDAEETIEGATLVEQTQAQLDRARLESEARLQGWKPIEEFTGAAGTWRDAPEFMQRGREIAAFVRKDLEKSQRQVETLTTEVREVRSLLERTNSALAEARAATLRADKAGYDRALKDLKAQQREAAQAANIEVYDEVSERISEVEEAQRTATAPVAPVREEPQPQVRQQVLAPEIQEFINENPWFMGPNAVQVLHTAMHAEHVKLLDKAPGLSLRDNLQRAKEKVMAEFPEKFGLEPNQPPARTPTRTTVAAPSQGNSGRQPAKPTGIDSITDPGDRAAARAGFDSYRRNDPDATEEEYVALLDDPKLDVLELRRMRAQRPAPQPRRAANAAR